MWAHAADHPLVTVFVLALGVRLINVALLTGRDAFFAEQDAIGYWALGAALAKPDTFWPTLSSLTDRMPLYLLLLAGIQHALGDAGERTGHREGDHLGARDVDAHCRGGLRVVAYGAAGPPEPGSIQL